jgi:hypothetical protein
MTRLIWLHGWADERKAGPQLDVWVNPDRIAYLRCHADGRAGTRIYFAEDGVLDVAEDPRDLLDRLGAWGVLVESDR